MYTEITHNGPLYCNVNNDVTDDLLNYELSKILIGLVQTNWP